MIKCLFNCFCTSIFDMKYNHTIFKRHCIPFCFYKLHWIFFSHPRCRNTINACFYFLLFLHLTISCLYDPCFFFFQKGIDSLFTDIWRTADYYISIIIQTQDYIFHAFSFDCNCQFFSLYRYKHVEIISFFTNIDPGYVIRCIF